MHNFVLEMEPINRSIDDLNRPSLQQSAPPSQLQWLALSGEFLKIINGL
jgi:hypothetical protein